MNVKFKKIIMIAVIMVAAIVAVLGSQFVVYQQFARQTVSIVSIEKTDSTDNVDTYTVLYSNGSSYQFTITNGQDGQDGQDGADGADAEKVSIQEIYQDYVAQNGEISYADFLANYLQLSTDYSAVINECLLSSMKVYTEFCVTSSSGSRPFQTTTTKSVSIQCGSAVIYQMDNDTTYIITNYHMVYNQSANADNGGYIAKKIVGYLYGSEGSPTSSGTTDENGYAVYDYGNYGIELTYCGGSVEYDLAVLKVATSQIKAVNAAAQAVKLADEYHVGETAIAIGNPENEGISASQGIVSIDNEYIQLQIDNTTRNYRSIRIDTAIYGGSSGGGLFNQYGKLIGITNAGDNDDQNINYAIPVQVVKGVVDNILTYYDGTNATSAYKITLGVTVDSANAKYVYDATTGYGRIKEDVVIKTVVDDSIAVGLGLQVDDILQAIVVNGTTYTLDRNFEVGDILLTVRADDVIAIVYTRDGNTTQTADYQVTSADLKAIA